MLPLKKPPPECCVKIREGKYGGCQLHIRSIDLKTLLRMLLNGLIYLSSRHQVRWYTSTNGDTSKIFVQFRPSWILETFLHRFNNTALFDIATVVKDEFTWQSTYWSPLHGFHESMLRIRPTLCNTGRVMSNQILEIIGEFFGNILVPRVRTTTQTLYTACEEGWYDDALHALEISTLYREDAPAMISLMQCSRRFYYIGINRLRHWTGCRQQLPRLRTGFITAGLLATYWNSVWEHSGFQEIFEIVPRMFIDHAFGCLEI